MKVHKLTIMVIDFDEVGAAEAGSCIENARYPNRCIMPDFISAETWEIGEWEDDNQINLLSKRKAAIKALFATQPESTIGGDE